jgi:HEAT repeat protein
MNEQARSVLWNATAGAIQGCWLGLLVFTIYLAARLAIPEPVFVVSDPRDFQVLVFLLTAFALADGLCSALVAGYTAFVAPSTAKAQETKGLGLFARSGAWLAMILLTWGGCCVFIPHCREAMIAVVNQEPTYGGLPFPCWARVAEDRTYHPWRRRAAIEALRFSPPDREVIGALARVVGDPDDDISLAAAQVVSAFGDAGDAAVWAIQDAGLRAGFTYQAARYVEALCRLGRSGVNTTSALVSVILERDLFALEREDVYESVLDQLHRDANFAVPLICSHLGGLRSVQAAILLSHLGPDAAGAVPSLTRAVKDRQLNAWVRGEAARALILLAGADATPILVDIRKTEGDKVPFGILEALWAGQDYQDLSAVPPETGRIAELAAECFEPGKAMPNFVSAYANWTIAKHQRAALVFASGGALREMGMMRAIGDRQLRCLIEVLKVPGSDVRVQVCRVLRKQGDKAGPAIPALRELLQETHSFEVRRAAIEVLAAIGPQARVALPDLTRALQGEDSRVRMAACLALWRLDGQHQPLLGMLRHPDPSVRTQIALTIGDLGAIAVPALVAALRARKGEEDSIETRELVIALGKVGPDARQALPVLFEMMRTSQDSWVVRDAIKAIDPWAYFWSEMRESLKYGAIGGVVLAVAAGILSGIWVACRWFLSRMLARRRCEAT